MARQTKKPRQSKQESAKCFFWKLPQELLDQVFDYAYGHNYEGKILTKTAFTFNEKEKYRSSEGTHEPVPWSNTFSKVNDFLVSKEFFVNAARTWMTAQQWPWEKMSTNQLLMTGLFRQHGTHLGLSGPYPLRSAGGCAKLQVVEIELSDDDFEACRKFVWVDKLEPKDFEALPITADIKQLSRLKEFRLSTIHCYYAKEPAKKAMLEQNRKAYEAYLQKFVTQSKEFHKSLESTIKAMPLYLGSRVRFDSSEMLDEDGDNDSSLAGRLKAMRKRHDRAAAERKTKPRKHDEGEDEWLPDNSGRSISESKKKRPVPKKRVQKPTEPETAEELLDMLQMSPQEVYRMVKRTQEAEKIFRDMNF